MKRLLLVLLALVSLPALAREAARTAILPPNIAWNGASRALVVPSGDRWITPAEASGFRLTPTYDETVAYLRRLVAAAPQLKMTSIGKSAEGRDIWMIVASSGGPAARKPRVLAQGGIHSGEIDGKDAGLMLLRDMTVRGTKRDLLELADFLFVPIFSVDGHERSSEFSRINQRGPENAGWRTTARNLNLNRDYMKADSEEMRAMIAAIRKWDPDLYLDLHVTDGADYQYDITFGFNGPTGFSPATSGWLESAYAPEVTRALDAAGHIPGPLVFGVSDDDLSKGIQLGNTDPRLSHSYGDARHIASVILENHSLKPYDQRVLGTYVFLEASLRAASANVSSLRLARSSDRARHAPLVPFDWVAKPDPQTIEFRGIEWKYTLSPVSGAVRVEYTGKPVTMRLPLVIMSEVSISATRPAAYWVPAAWREVIEKLDLHGIRYDRTTAPREVDVDMYRLGTPVYTTPQFEGHVRVTAQTKIERRRERFAAGSVRVPTDQALGTLAVLLLEPASPDSLFQWGFLNSILSPTEYVEAYVMEPMAERMLAEDPALAEEFRNAIVSDEKLRTDPKERLQWFYRRTPFYDERALLYPIARE
ncbi:MAG TPA: M14 family metallopeptidase [Thermoanaerobaculia bacterium]|nr:M14 family metallopeptidase [Thermoanaerobaculia bacterium]